MTKLNLALCFALPAFSMLTGQSNFLDIQDDVGLFNEISANYSGATLFDDNPDETFTGFSLSEFTASNHDDGILLEWTTDSEFEASYFKIEHSVNGKDFLVIGEVTAAGTTDGNLEYEFFYKPPKYRHNFFRLQLIDVNEDHTFSNIQKVGTKTIIENLPANAFQNGAIIINIDGGLKTNTILYLLDDMGKIIEATKIGKGANVIKQKTSGLESGQYYLQFHAAFGFKTYAFAKE